MKKEKIVDLIISILLVLLISSVIIVQTFKIRKLEIQIYQERLEHLEGYYDDLVEMLEDYYENEIYWLEKYYDLKIHLDNKGE